MENSTGQMTWFLSNINGKKKKRKKNKREKNYYRLKEKMRNNSQCNVWTLNPPVSQSGQFYSA